MKMLTNCNISENVARDIVGHGSEVIIWRSSWNLSGKIWPWEVWLVVCFQCAVSCFRFFNFMHMTLPLKKEVVKLSHLPCDGKNFPSRIHISVFPPQAAGSLRNNRTFNSFQGQHDLKGQGWVEYISEHQSKQMVPAVLSRSCNMLQYNVHEVL